MRKSLLEYNQYKTYLKDTLEGPETNQRGQKAKLAKDLGIQTTYLSQVLRGQAHLSLEQAERLNRAWGHTEQESHYFLLLVQLARAGTPQLKKYFEEQLEAVKQERFNLHKRLGLKSELSTSDQAAYYSSWVFAALHVFASIPDFQTRDALAKKLDLSPSQVGEALDFLVQIGVINEKNGKYTVGKTSMHVPNTSNFVVQHHTNWRLQAIRSFEKRKSDDIHYTSCVTLSHADAATIKSQLIDQIKSVKNTVKVSKDEMACCFLLDFFEM